MKKKFTYILLITVFTIWGIIFYRLFFLKSESEAVVSKTTKHIPPKKTIAEPYEIIGSYPDPFFERKMIINNPQIMTHQTIEFIPPQEEQIDIPPLKYIGLIQNPSSKKRITLINFENMDIMLKVGDTKNGITLLENSEDCIKIKYQGVTKLICK